MKSLVIAVSAFLMAVSVNLSAQTGVPAAGLKITSITGTVQLVKDGMVVMTLKPGDAIPSLVDPSMTFVVVTGAVEVQAGGQTVTGAAGSNFTVASVAGNVNVAVTAGSPVQVVNAGGNTTVIAPNSAVNMTTVNGQTTVAVQSGSAMVTNASGGAPVNLQAGQTVTVSSPAVPVTRAAAPAVTGQTTNQDTVVPAPVTVPQTATSQTQTVQESCELSASTPGCNN